MDLKNLTENCKAGGSQWALDVYNETEATKRAAVKWGAGDVGDGALVTAQTVVTEAGAKWADVPEANRGALVDAVLAGAAREWTVLRATEAG